LDNARGIANIKITSEITAKIDRGL